MSASRRETLAGALGASALSLIPGLARAKDRKPQPMRDDVIIVNALVTTLDRENPRAEAVAIRDGRFLAVGSEQEVRAAFQGARNDEYEEIVDRCEDFLGQVKKEYVASHFTYAELEENEVDLVKLRTWFARVRARDAFGATGRPEAEKALEACQQSLDDYTARVYAEEEDGH